MNTKNMSKQERVNRANHINSLMQSGKSNQEARQIANKAAKNSKPQSDYNGDNIDRSYDSPWQDWAESGDDF